MCQYIIDQSEQYEGVDFHLITKDHDEYIPYFINLQKYGLNIACAKYVLTNRCYSSYVPHNKKIMRLYNDDTRFNHESCVNKPAVGVRYDYALKYCEWLSSLLNQHVDIMTSDEWEKVARLNLSSDAKYPTYNGQLSSENANYNLNIGMTTEVDKYRANQTGIHDMGGNVLEWTKTSSDELLAIDIGVDIGNKKTAGNFIDIGDKKTAGNLEFPIQNNKKPLKIKRVLKGGGWPFYINTCSIDFIVTMSARSDYYFIGMRPIIRL